MRKSISPAADLAETPTLRWYVAETRQSHECVTLRHMREWLGDGLGAQGWSAYLPLRRAGPKATKIKAVAFFPRYLFVRLIVGAEGWTDVLSVEGVQSLLGNNRPFAVSDNIIESLRAHQDGEGFIPIRRKASEPAFRAGERVRILTGALAGFEGVYSEPLDAKRNRILVSCFGRDSRLEVDTSALQSVA